MPKAEALITACPLCRYNLVANAAADAKMPVYYFTELLAEALGITLPKEAGVNAKQ
jgi:heterodisulfide reductase subunit B